MTNFKDFLARCKEGKHIRVLFIVPRTHDIADLVVSMTNHANEMGLCPLYRQTGRWFDCENGRAKIVVAHPYVADQLVGMSWQAVYGFDHLDKYGDEGVRAVQRISAYVRRHENDVP